MNELILQTKNLSFSYKKELLVLNDINFSVSKNEKIILLASKGMGKTTFLSVVSSFQSKYSGKVFFNGKELKTINDEEKMFSFLPNVPVFFDNKTIKDNINYFIKINKLHNKPKIYKKNGFFNENMNKKVKTLSLCEKRILSIYRSLMKNPSLIFIDDMFDELMVEDLDKISNVYLNELNNFSSNIFYAFGDESYKKCKNIIKKLKFNRIFYLFDSKMIEYNSISDFETNIINVNQMLFIDNNNFFYGNIFIKDGNYYFEKDSEIIALNDLSDEIKNIFLKLNLEECENEEVVVYYNDFSLNDFENFEQLLNQKKLMIFEKLGGDRLI